LSVGKTTFNKDSALCPSPLRARIANTAEHQREVLEQIKKEYIEGKIPVKRLAYEIKQRLGISQAPAYDLRIKLIEEIGKEKVGKCDQREETDHVV
jgi:hypothetical protein